MPPIAALAFIAGVYWLQTQSALPPVPWTGAAAVALVAVAAVFHRSRARLPLAVLAMFAVGFGWAAFRAEVRLAKTLPPQLMWKDILVEGTVRDFPSVNERRTRFDFAIERVISPRRLTLAANARLSDYHHSAPPLTVFSPGARLQLKIRVRAPVSYAGGFDYAGHLFARDIRLLGYVRGRDSVQVIARQDTLRTIIRRRIAALPAGGALLAALAVGDRSMLDESRWRTLQRTGTAHLVSVSGTHITLAAGFVALLSGFLWRRSRFLMRRMPAQKAALLCAVPAALGYALLSGFNLPAQRSFFMLAAAAAAVIGGASPSPLAVLAGAAVLVVALDPWAVLSPGFWLSFILTAAIVAVALARPTMAWWRYFLYLQLCLSLVAIPLTLLFFHQASLVSPLANFIAVPAVGILLPPILLDILLPGDYLWRAAASILSAGWYFLRFLSDLPYAAWTPAAAPAAVSLLALGGAAWVCMPAGVPGRLGGLLPIAAVLLWTPAPLGEGEWRMTVWNVGQGTAVLIQTRRHVMVYDAGPPAAGRGLQLALRKLGIRRLHKLMISHDDSDHRGGGAALLDSLAVESVHSSLPLTHPLNRRGAAAQRCHRGQNWRWDDVHFQVLNPTMEEYAGAIDDNDLSCVLHIRGGGASVLLAGDISGARETVLLARGDLPPADVLLAAHHGSRHSSTPPFIAAVRASTVIFSVGKNNRYGHPHADTTARFSAAAVYSTADDGDIVINFSPAAKVSLPRQKSYWH